MRIINITLATYLICLFQSNIVFAQSGTWGNSRVETFTTSGNVGIGTTEPATTLHIKKPNPAIRLEESNVRTWDIALDNAPDSLQLRDQTLGTIPLTIGSTGNVGIGTTSPTWMFDIYNDANTIGGFRVNQDVAISGGKRAFHVYSNVAQTDDNGVFARFHLDHRSSTMPLLHLRQDGSGDILQIDDGSTRALTIENGGNVGIGTTDPSRQVEIQGASKEGYLALTRSDAGTSNLMGSLLYGNSVDDSLVHIRAFEDGANDAGRLEILTEGTGGGADIRMTINSKGNVGIGTMTPGRSLEIISPPGTRTAYWKSGTNDASSTFLIRNSDSTDLFDLDSDGDLYVKGKVGIGTTNPQSELSVSGTITAKEIKVESGWSDFVFDEDYDLASLDEVESFIHENKHLPDIPSAEKVAQKGLAVSEILAKQMKKIEELTLYIIEQNRKIKKLEEQMAILEKISSFE